MKIEIGALPLSLFLLFLVLKLTKAVAWSWLWVTSPLWIGFAIGCALVAVMALIMVVGITIAAIAEWRK
jgi:hypothetical protein